MLKKGRSRAMVTAFAVLSFSSVVIGPSRFARAQGTGGRTESRANDVSQNRMEDSPQVQSGDSVGAADIRLDDELLRQTKGTAPYQPWKSLKEGLGLLFDRQNQWTLVTAGLVLAGTRSLDEEAQEYFDHRKRLGGLSYYGNHVLGTGVPGTLLGAGFWLFGDLLDRPYAAHAGQAQIETLLVTGLVTAAMKGAFNRERPDGSDRYSFPSGHTSTVFASAMVLHEFYGWKVGGPAFLLGAITAASRLQDNRHWLSDTIGGATLGIVIGHAFSRAHLDRYKAYEESRFVITPVVEPGGGRVVLSFQF